MEQTNALPEQLVVKRGGYAQYFIYLPIIMLLGLVNAVFKIPPPYLYYLYMAIGLVAVMGMNQLQALLFTKPVIIATKEGIWTRKLNLVAWSGVKDIRIEKTYTFSGNTSGSVMLDLIIETTDNRESVFAGGFLNTDPTNLCALLNSYRKTYQSSTT